MFPPEMTSERVSENMGPMWHGPCLNPNVHEKYSRRCHMKCPLPWLSPGLSVVDRPSPAFRQHGNNHQWSLRLAVQLGCHLEVMFGHVKIQQPTWWQSNKMGHCPHKRLSNVHKCCSPAAFLMLKFDYCAILRSRNSRHCVRVTSLIRISYNN